MKQQALSAQKPTTAPSLLHLCVHGHFYQPLRVNPFTGIITDEESATPHTNWNERITAECYQPNAQLGNFEEMSYDIGPTLAS